MSFSPLNPLTLENNDSHRGGIVGRGLLVDYHGWRQQTGQPPVTIPAATIITTEEVESVLKHQKTHLRDGDILILRTGFTDWHVHASIEEQEAASKRGAFIGLEATEESAKWIWNHHFAAVATDTLGFEVNPIPFLQPGVVRLHEWLLVHWGTPIGELWDLERLAEVCRERRQWSFFLTGGPLHVVGGVGTQPNVIAIL
ncbi:hypothetical protein Z517_07639 [Fonsecaea pedrosoi CBS 271.37]|uniref:Cyclase n=1 Tax=Fonsecaea pedrosoi CBS 271.37 TaxID=1442368 RepID=A0A0D2DJG5_9EURO|nr:uncharacterized protein Z517_07639 [Fonsecaea pedrosoi CBS 271.37]KIW77806.1 hypothetical protein Z517_07639 [Fonsecaea pedrosoi CBS 271.37]